MDKTKKQIQNRLNYLKNREKILQKAKVRSPESSKTVSNVIPLFKSEVVQRVGEKMISQVKKRTLRINREVFFLCPMIALMTYYLISESAKFYQFADGDQTGAYVKALIAEGIILVFSGFKAHTRTLRWLYRSVLILACVYSLWALSAKNVSEVLNRGTQAVQNQKALKELEIELEKRMEARSHFLEANRLSIAKGYEASIDTLQSKLEKLRSSAIEVGSPLVMINTMMTLVFFRAIVMIANALCMNRLKRGIRFRQYSVSAG